MAMHVFRGTVAVATAVIVVSSWAAADDKTFGTIDRKDPRFDKLVPPGAALEKLADGFTWAEGPVWVPKKDADGDFLLFSDVPNNTVFRWKAGEGVKPFLKPSGYTGSTPRGGEPGSNGLTLDAEHRLVLCQHGDRRVARLEPDGKQTVLASQFEGKRFNSPNDLVYHSNGDLYFTDPPYGLEKNVNDPAKELPFCGVFRIAKDGKLTLLTKELSFPNGIAFSPDEKTLYIAISDFSRPVVMAYDVQADGTIANGRVFFDAKPWLDKGLKGLPDGMKVDREGNLFTTGPGGVFVLSPKGEYLGRIDPGCATANCGWGEDGSVLYITADKSICRIKTTTKGKGY
jgi:gluconolactonase